MINRGSHLCTAGCKIKRLQAYSACQVAMLPDAASQGSLLGSSYHMAPVECNTDDHVCTNDPPVHSWPPY